MNKRFCLVLALLFMIISLSAFAQTSGDPGEKGESKQKLSGKEASGAADENITRLVPAEEIAALARVDGYVGNAPRRARELAETIRASLLVADPS